MAEEEDVVFENSALYEHLKEVGFTDADIGTETVNLRETKGRLGSAVTTYWKHWLAKVFDHVTLPIQRISASSILLSASSKQQQCARYIVFNILSCPVLEEEDAAVIQHYTCDTDDINARSRDMSCDVPPWSSDSTIRHECIWRVMLSSVQMASLAHLFYRQWQRTVQYLDLSAVAISVSALAMRQQVVMAKRACDATRPLCHFNSAIGKFYKLMKKSIRLIQETELIAKGFTIVSNNSAICQLEKANLQASRRQSTELRRILFEAARNCMILFKTQTAKLLKERLVTHTCSYMATISLEDYGPCVILPSSSTQLELATDNFSITALKSMVHLCSAHMSEFLRVFALAYFSCNKFMSARRADKDFREMSSVVNNMHSDFGAYIEHLEQAYTLHQCSWKQETTAHRNTAFHTSRNESHSGAVYMTVHSLSLHLQAVLKRVHDLEIQLEALNENDDLDLTTDLKMQLASDLKVIKVNLDACSDCWESLNNLDRQTSDIHRDTDLLGENNQSEDNDMSPDVNTPLLIDMSEPLLEDQMYEAFPDHDNVAHTNTEDDSNWLPAKEQKARERREKKEAVRMLSELKGVIALRALERSCNVHPSQSSTLPDHLKEIHSHRTEEQPSSVGSVDCMTDSDIHSEAVTEPETCTVASDISTVTNLSHETRSVDDIFDQRDDTSHPPVATTKVAFGLYGSIVVDGAGDGAGGRFPHLDKQPTQHDICDDVSQENGQDSEDEDKETSSGSQSPQPLGDKSDNQDEPTVVTQGQTYDRQTSGMSFTATVAMQAVSRSRQMAALSVDTFGDDSNSEDSDEEDGERNL